jgi:hypothetical protein
MWRLEEVCTGPICFSVALVAPEESSISRSIHVSASWDAENANYRRARFHANLGTFLKSSNHLALADLTEKGIPFKWGKS